MSRPSSQDLIAELAQDLWFRLRRSNDLWIMGPIFAVTGWITIQLLAWAAPYLAALVVSCGALMFFIGVLKAALIWLNRLFGIHYPPRIR